MDATTELSVRRDRTGRSVLHRVSCEAPLLFRVAADDGDELVLSWVNGAAGPLGGDRLRLRLVVDDGAAVRIRSTGASLVHPGPTGEVSTFDISVELGLGSSLDWWPEPTVSVRASRHRTSMVVRAAGDASARVVETVVRGRHDEPGGQLAVHQRVEVDGVPVLDQEVELGDGARSGPGAHGAARTALTAVTLGAAFRPTRQVVVSPAVVAAVLELDGGAAAVTATADDLRTIAALDLLRPANPPRDER